jgi:CMP-N-acetylneuraminic acid synthetase
MKTDALVVARSGSKGIYIKNLILLRGKPLIEYTLEAAVQAYSVRNTYLATDDGEVISKYKDYGRIKIIDCPKGASDGKVSIKKIITNALKSMGKEKPEIIVLLFPTTPLRTASHIESAISFARTLPSFDSIAAVARLRGWSLGELTMDERKKVGINSGYGCKHNKDQD